MKLKFGFKRFNPIPVLSTGIEGFGELSLLSGTSWRMEYRLPNLTRLICSVNQSQSEACAERASVRFRFVLREAFDSNRIRIGIG